MKSGVLQRVGAPTRAGLGQRGMKEANRLRMQLKLEEDGRNGRGLSFVCIMLKGTYKEVRSTKTAKAERPGGGCEPRKTSQLAVACEVACGWGAGRRG